MASVRKPHPSQRNRAALAATHPRRPRVSQTKRRPARRGTSRRRKRVLRIPLASFSRRLRVALVVMAIAISLCAGRLLQLQGFDSSAYAATAARQMTRSLPLLPARGQLTDRNGLVLAQSEPAVAITADPVHTAPKATEIAAILSTYLGGDAARFIQPLTKPGTRFVYLQKKVPAATYARIANELDDRDLYGIFRESDPIRTYPGDSIASGVVGFSGADNSGQAGFEYSMNAELAGKKGLEVYESAPNGNKIPLGTNVLTPAVNGTNYQLTLDSELQMMVQRRLAEQVAARQAASGFAIVMNVKTGEVLAMANAPTFDSNQPGKSPARDRGNRAVSDEYEPGSVEKILTMSALIDQGLIKPSTKVRVEPSVISGGAPIKDVWDHGVLRLTARGILAKSSNIGTVLLARQSKKQQMHDYLASFGLGSRTGIELPGEGAGHLPEAGMADATRDQISFGQGLSVTGIQEAAAIAAIANGGVYNQPTVIKSATGADQKPILIRRPEPRRVVSEKTSAAVRSMMESVLTSGGSGRKLPLKDFRMAGKSGTAERYNSSCRCYRGYTASWVGIAPANDPDILSYVVLQKPKRGNSGSALAGPVSNDIMRYALPRYAVLPSTTKGPKGGLEW